MKCKRTAPKHVKPYKAKSKPITQQSKPKPAATQKTSRLTNRMS